MSGEGDPRKGFTSGGCADARCFAARRKVHVMRILSVLLLTAVLGGCLSEVNKPIGPGDPWRARSEEFSRPMGVD